MRRLFVFLGASIVIFEARVDALPYAFGAALVAWLSLRWLPPAPSLRLRPLRLLAFAPHFIWLSLRGGFDVALRAFRGPRSLAPGFVDFPLRIRSPGTRVAFINIVSLMPGTFTARLVGDRLVVHTLDTASDVESTLRRVETLVRRVGGEQP